MAQVEQQQAHGEGTYTFQSKPKAIHNSRPKYRIQYADEGPVMYGNIMYDRRVVRGNTYAQTTLPLTQQPDPIEMQRKQEIRRRAIAKQRAREQLRQHSPPPVEGRQHIEVQTELYLECITDRIEEADVDTQTDAFLDRPPTPLFIPAKSGKDVETQIYEGDLFDFNLEVKPILEVLVGKTLEQSQIEVLEEEELANLRQQQREFEELRNAELVEMQRLEEQERRHREEKQRRMKQQKEALEKERQTADKIAARAFAQSYLADLLPSVFSTLRVNGFFFDPVERDIEEEFLPTLVEQVAHVMESKVMARTLLDELIRDTCVSRLNSFELGARGLNGQDGDDLDGEGADGLNGDGTDDLNGDGTDGLNGDGTDGLNGDGTDGLNGDGTDGSGQNGDGTDGKDEVDVPRPTSPSEDTQDFDCN